jgi:uncharacterized protein (TIGR02172 family)
MSVLERPIAVGRTAEVYPFEEGKVLKLFFPTIPPAWIDKEIDTGRYIHDAQLPVPKVYETVNLDERRGVVYERIEGPSLLNQLGSKPWRVTQIARLLANLHAQVHSVPGPPGLETQQEWATGGIPQTDKLPIALRDRVLELLHSMPAGDRLCHGDFHPGNIIATDRGPVIIDWMTASRGTDCGDVARTAVILEAAQAPEGTPLRWLLEWIRKSALATYLKTYFRLRPVDPRTFAAWRAIMAANFLADVSLPEEQAHLAAMVEAAIRSVEGN